MGLWHSSQIGIDDSLNILSEPQQIFFKSIQCAIHSRDYNKNITRGLEDICFSDYGPGLFFVLLFLIFVFE